MRITRYPLNGAGARKRDPISDPLSLPFSPFVRRRSSILASSGSPREKEEEDERRSWLVSGSFRWRVTSRGEDGFRLSWKFPWLGEFTGRVYGRCAHAAVNTRNVNPRTNCL